MASGHGGLNMAPFLFFLPPSSSLSTQAMENFQGQCRHVTLRSPGEGDLEHGSNFSVREAGLQPLPTSPAWPSPLPCPYFYPPITTPPLLCAFALN